jgi:lysophospholipase L1-like esterase
MSDVNLTPAKYPNWNTAVSAVRGATGFARLHCIGDSTTLGTFAGDVANIYPNKLEALMEAWVPAQRGSIWAGGDASQSWADSRITMGSGWALSAIHSLSTQGDAGWTGTSGSGGSLAFALPWSIDTIRVRYAKNAGLGSFTVNVDGGSSLGTISTSAGSDGIGVSTVTCSAGVHTVNFATPSGGDVYPLTVEAWLSTANKVLVSDGGTGGSASADWIVSSIGWQSWYTLNAFAPDLVIVTLGTNDISASVSAGTYQSNLSTLIDRIQLTSEVLLCTPVPGSGKTTEDAAYLAALTTLAGTKNCGLVDLNLAGRFVDYATANGNSYMADGVHPNTAGYAFWAGIMNSAMQSITTSTSSGHSLASTGAGS